MLLNLTHRTFNDSVDSIDSAKQEAALDLRQRTTLFVGCGGLPVHVFSNLDKCDVFVYMCVFCPLKLLFFTKT